MSDSIIERLAAELTPVRRLAPPTLRAFVFLGLLALVALVWSHFSNLALMEERLTGAPDAWLAVVGSVTTAITATIAAFQISMPDRRDAWLLLPLPSTLLWLGASGLGCLRSVLIPTTHTPTMHEGMDCLIFILLVAIPLSAVLVVMLRQAKPLRPARTAAMAGLASAAAAASLLWFSHPFDASAVDLAAHVIAVGLVVLVNRLLGGRLLGR